MGATGRRTGAVSITLAIIIGACGGDSDSGGSPTTTTTASPTAATTTSPTSPPATSAPRTEELRFSAGGFDLEGVLVLPDGQGPHPAVIIVSGSGSQTRSSTPGYSMLLAKFGAAGYAVVSWDKPGSGDSTGALDPEHTLTDRADIVLAAIDEIVGHDAIDRGRIGLWGLSQAGWVMPLVLDRTEDVAFMISVSGGGEDSIDQLGYQLGRDHWCAGGSLEEAELIETYMPQSAKGGTHELYVEAMNVLAGIEGVDRIMSVEIADEDHWQPWPPEIDSYLDPMDVIEHTTIPVLAVFGELDRYIDPVQGADAYELALNAAGNEHYHVELIPGVGHTMLEQTSMCSGGGTMSERYLELLDEWITRVAAA